MHGCILYYPTSNKYSLFTEFEVPVSYKPSFSFYLFFMWEAHGLSWTWVAFSTTRERWVNSVLAHYSLAWLSRKSWIIIQTLGTKFNKQFIRMRWSSSRPQLIIFNWWVTLNYAVISRWSIQFVQRQFRDPSCVILKCRRDDHKICKICISWSWRLIGAVRVDATGDKS